MRLALLVLGAFIWSGLNHIAGYTPPDEPFWAWSNFLSMDWWSALATVVVLVIWDWTDYEAARAKRDWYRQFKHEE